MFQFPGFASLLRAMTGVATSRVAPFGHLGIIACVPLPRAFRSLPRPSSPPCAQASSTCLRLLDYNSPPTTSRARAIFTSDNLLRKSLSLIRYPTIYHLLPLSNSVYKKIEMGIWMCRGVRPYGYGFQCRSFGLVPSGCVPSRLRVQGAPTRQFR
jgi:hypothetical protein